MYSLTNTKAQFIDFLYINFVLESWKANRIEKKRREGKRGESTIISKWTTEEPLTVIERWSNTLNASFDSCSVFVMNFSLTTDNDWWTSNFLLYNEFYWNFCVLCPWMWIIDKLIKNSLHFDWLLTDEYWILKLFEHKENHQ